MPNFIDGEVVLIDKPLTWTSFDVVNKFRYYLKASTGVKKIKVGHAGTLDPLATGLLIVCTGKKTKTIEQLQGQLKEYTGIIQLGATTASYDLESKPENFIKIDHLEEREILDVAKNMVGEQDQLPPIFSAKKIDGKRAYDLARAGETPKMRTKLITIETFEVTKIEKGEVSFRIICTKGTYIRSIAHDFGKILKVGGYLKALRRTKIGEYSVLNAKSMEDLHPYSLEHTAN